jgi:hypothetical protein
MDVGRVVEGADLLGQRKRIVIDAMRAQRLPPASFA